MIVVIAGTRPELLKLSPLCLEFRKVGLPFQVILTGQHTGLAEDTGFLTTFQPELLRCDLPPLSPDPFANVQLLRGILRFLMPPEATLVIVQGDTASALAGAEAAADCGIPVAHVEAGLRSFCHADPWPEESFRCQITRLASLHFAPTETAANHLLKEGVSYSAIHITGNTIVDMLTLWGIRRAEQRSGILVTLHRRHSNIEGILEGLSAWADRHPTIPVTLISHPNGLTTKYAFTSLIHVRPPMPYPAFLKTLCASQAILSDSGGLVEEAATLGIPCAIARAHTERPEALASGHAVLAGTDPTSIQTGLIWAAHASPEPSTVFGDGTASLKIASTILGGKPDFYFTRCEDS